MNNAIVKAPEIHMKELNSVFIEMSQQNCNMRCKHCYIDFPSKVTKDFIPVEKVRKVLEEAKKSEIKYIHLTGGEPMLHPDFNLILRLCLGVSSVVIHTNGSVINDKKARFLRKVEDEKNNDNEIIFRVCIDHFKEEINDSIRGRGSYRKSLHAVKSLYKYDFNPILTIVNHFNLPEEEIKTEFRTICSDFGFETEDLNFKIIPLFQRGVNRNIENLDMTKVKTDCSKSRTVTSGGIFTCPMMSTDTRGRCGSDLTDFSKKSYAESDFCTQCISYNKYTFCFDW